MNLRAAFRIARRELSGGLSAFRIFVICLALGVAAIVSVSSVKVAIEEGLRRDGARILGGQAELQFTYRFANAEENAWIDAVATERSGVVDFRSLVVVPGSDGAGEDFSLTQVKGVDAAYPLIGEVTLDPAIPLDQALALQEGGQPGAVMKAALADRLGLRVGDLFRMGTKDFYLSAILLVEPDATLSGFSLGPRTIVRTESLEGSGLLTPGTLFNSHERVLLAPDADIAALREDAINLFQDKGMRWKDFREGSPGVQEFVDRLGAFLVLVGLAGLAVGGIGVSAAVRAYLGSKIATIATLKTLGATRQTIFFSYFLQVAFMSVIAVAIGLLVGAALPILAAPLILEYLPLPIETRVYWGPLFEAAIYGILAAFLFSLWPVARTEDIRPAQLFRDAIAPDRPMPRLRYVVLSLVLAGALVGSAILFLGSPRLVLWTAAGLAGALSLLALSARFVRALSGRLARGRLFRGKPAVRMALGSVGGPGEEAASVILSLGLGLSVLSVIGQVDTNMRQAIQGNLPEIAPSYFFVDIQNQQLEGFLERVEGDPLVSQVETAPMLRGNLVRINGKPAREVAGDHWVIGEDRGLTFSETPPNPEELIAGEWWPEDYSGPPLVSFSADEGAEMGLRLGDNITINVLGREITAEISSFRAVSFGDAGMGFVMAFNPAAFAGAPHTYIATVYAEEEAEAAILRDLANKYPNVTGIHVRDAINSFAGIMTGLARGLAAGAGVTLITGFIVLIGAAAASVRPRVYEAAVLKSLGANRRTILISFALRSMILGAAAGLVALLTGVLGSWAVMELILDTTFQMSWSTGLSVVFGGVIATILAGLLFVWRPLAASPSRVLRART